MAKLSKVDAAKAAGVSRQTLYTYLKDGRLSADADGLIDTVELLRAGLTLHEIGRPVLDTSGHRLTSSIPPVDTLAVSRDMLALLTQQLQEAQAREQAALERERVARDREALLLQMLHEAQQRYDRLLEAPRPPPAAPSPVPTPTGQAARGAMRRRIVALLREHPEGLSPAQIRERLQAGKSLASTLHAMARDGLVRRVGPGRYVGT